MNIRTGLYGLILVTSIVRAEQPTQLFYDSKADFVEMSLTLKTADGANPQYVGVNVVLSPEARARTTALTTQAMNKSLTLYVNGRQLSTTTVRGVLGSGQMRFQIPRAMLPEMMPSLLR